MMMSKELDSSRRQPQPQEGPYHIVLIGNPGVGKSFLLNQLVYPLKFRTGSGLRPVTLDHELEVSNGVVYHNIPGILTSTVEETQANIKRMEKALLQEGVYKVMFVMTPNAGGRILNAIDVNEYSEFCEAYGMGRENVPIIFNNLPGDASARDRAGMEEIMREECALAKIPKYAVIYHTTEEHSPTIVNQLKAAMERIPWKPIQRLRDMDLFNKEKIAKLTAELNEAAKKAAEAQARAESAEKKAEKAGEEAKAAGEKAQKASMEAEQAKQQTGKVKDELHEVQREADQKVHSLTLQISTVQQQLQETSRNEQAATRKVSDMESQLSGLRSQLDAAQREASAAAARAAEAVAAAAARQSAAPPQVVMIPGGGGMGGGMDPMMAMMMMRAMGGGRGGGGGSRGGRCRR